MGASWTWQICDAAGSTLAELTTATGRSLTFKRNAPVEATFTLSHQDDAAQLLLDALNNTGVPKLRCYRRAANASAGVVRFRGPLANMQEEAEESSTLTPVFRSPFGVLLGDGNTTGRPVTWDYGVTPSYSGVDAGLIGKDLIDRTNAQSPTGLVVGSVEATKTRDRTYALGVNVGQSVQDLTSVLDGFDFTETFTDGTGTTDATLNIVASLGSDNPAARFEYGPTTLANVRSVSRETLPPQNCILIIGGNGLTAYYEDAASVDKYDRWYAKFEFTDVIEQATLDDKARALVRPGPVKTISFVPEAGLAPALFDDFNLGDTCRFFARDGALYEDVRVRVNSATVVISDDGEEATETPDPSSPEEDRVIRAQLTAEVVDE